MAEILKTQWYTVRRGDLWNTRTDDRMACFSGLLELFGDVVPWSGKLRLLGSTRKFENAKPVWLELRGAYRDPYGLYSSAAELTPNGWLYQPQVLPTALMALILRRFPSRKPDGVKRSSPCKLWVSFEAKGTN